MRKYAIHCIAIYILVYASGHLLPAHATGSNQDYAQATWNKSWIGIDYGTLTGHLMEGDMIDVNVEYYLDPAEHFGATKLLFEALGPRIPKPGIEGVQHIYYGNQRTEITPGRGKHTFQFRIPEASQRNRLLFLARFIDGRDKTWPWDTRASAWFVRKGGFFELDSEKPGNLFTYNEPVRMLALLKNVEDAGQKKILKYQVHDAIRTMVAEGSVEFTVERDGQTVPVDLDLKLRGVFSFSAEVDGWEKRDTTFARIPDIMEITEGKPTRFGMTGHSAPALGIHTEEVFQVARSLGLTTCRAFTEWQYIEPGPDVYMLKHWDKFFDSASKHDVDMVITVYRPAAWVLPEGKPIHYSMFDCDWDAWRNMVQTVTTRYKGKFVSWEWLNEITPGGSVNYVDDYAKLCRIGTETARTIDPDLYFTLAGGLWPRSFRLQVLAAGAGKYVDVLPVHYSNGSMITEAREDLDSFGHDKVTVWDNESGISVINWDVPVVDQIADTIQPNWVLTQWADELAAGCEKIIYFGGEGSATGDFDYVMDDLTPRPLAATLAVFVSKIFQAEPVGMFFMGKGGLFHLFERDGKAVLVASSYEEGGEEISLPVGAESVRITDYQGNEKELNAQNNTVPLKLQPLRYFVEGGDLDILKANLVPNIQVHEAGGKRERITFTPRLALLRGKPGRIDVRLHNVYDRQLAGAFRFDIPTEWLVEEEVEFSLEPGEERIVPLLVTVPEEAELGEAAHSMIINFSWKKLPQITKPFILSITAPESVGNLLINGDFETPDESGAKPEAWNGVGAKLVSSDGLGIGLGRNVLKFEKPDGWAYYGQNVELTGGLTYLYTAWIWNQDMEGGSNLTQHMKDGSSSSLYNNQVINMGTTNPYWQVFTCRYKSPESLDNAGFSPVANGSGWALFDNMRLTVFEGTDFAAECYKVTTRPTIDGNLDDWQMYCPIPLIGKNQLTVLDKSYQWNPKNLNAVAYLKCDNANLYVAVQVMDDVHHPTGSGESVIEGDSVILAFDPTNRSIDGANKAFAYYVSSMKPAGGSGVHSLVRPEKLSSGLRSGHLTRDSSVGYEIAIKQDEGACTYEICLPFTELGSMEPLFGGKFAFSIQLNDNDGSGLVSHMNWGGGLSPVWKPANSGVVTFIISNP
ncbi:sugar-binding protein [Candidatus Poribacteria bacterium]